MTMGWAWLILLLATYPWLLGADLASDALASSSLVFFVSGACLIAPSRRLKRWQMILFAGCLGFLFEARRPIPDGALALSLVAAAIFLSTQRQHLRNTPGMLRAQARMLQPLPAPHRASQRKSVLLARCGRAAVAAGHAYQV